MGRRTKSLIPTATELLLPNIIKPQIVKEQVHQQKRMQKFYYDKHTKPLPTLRIKDMVMLKAHNTLKPATVTAVLDVILSHYTRGENTQKKQTTTLKEQLYKIKY